MQTIKVSEKEARRLVTSFVNRQVAFSCEPKGENVFHVTFSDDFDLGRDLSRGLQTQIVFELIEAERR